MAPRQLMVRFRKYKIKQKRERPKAFASKASGGLSRHAMAENASFQYNRRGGGNADWAMQRLHHYIKTRKPHHTILYWIFNPAIRHASEEMYQPVKPEVLREFKKVVSRTSSGFAQEFIQETEEVVEESLHPKIAAELLEQQYIDQDPALKVFQFDCILLEHSDYHDKWMFFRGRECFLVFRKDKEVRQSRMYRDPAFLKRLHLRKVEWAGEPMYLDQRDSFLADDP